MKRASSLEVVCGANFSGAVTESGEVYMWGYGKAPRSAGMPAGTSTEVSL